jgi:hypothetical protein
MSNTSHPFWRELSRLFIFPPSFPAFIQNSKFKIQTLSGIHNIHTLSGIHNIHTL